MSIIEQLEFLGRGYAGLGAGVSAVAGAIMIYMGYKLNNTPGNKDGDTLIYGGVAVIAVGVSLWILASKYDSIAAISGIWLIVAAISAIVAVVKGDK